MDKLNLMPKLTQQVLSNAEEIQRVEAKVDAHYNEDRVLADYGIRVVGRADTVNDLPPVDDFPGTFGDAYVVGMAPPYDFYVYTRPFAGETENQWLDIGLLAIEGPQGEPGEQGPKGETGEPGRSTRWYSGQGAPYMTANEGDMFLDVFSGDVYQYNNNWERTGNIKGNPGAQGPRGLQGEQGPIGPRGIDGPRGEAGYSVVIAGILSSADMLPDPDTVDRHTAYIVEDGQRWLYFITGDIYSLIWERVPFSAGTAVMSNDQILGTFNADSKVNAVSDRYILYGTDNNGNETTYPIDTGEPGSILIRNGDNNIVIPDPVGELEAANKQYVDNAIANADYVRHADIELDTASVYGRTANGTDTIIPAGTATAGYIPIYTNTGRLRVAGMPTASNEVANKAYVDVYAKAQAYSASQRTVGAILSILGYTSLPTNKIIRLVVSPLKLNSSNISSQQGIGLSKDAMLYHRIEITIVGNNTTAIGYKYNGTLSYLGAITFTSQIYSNATMGIFAEIKESQ